MKLRYLLLLPGLAYASYTQADIYKRVDADGHVTYSSTPIKGGKKLDLGPLPTMAPFKGGDASLRVDQALQKNRDEARRKILQDELASEEKLLGEARQNLKDVEDNPQISHAGGKSFRNVAKYEEDVKSAQGDVALHERNIEALRAELAQFK